MSTADERRDELVAAAVTDDLDDAERAELDALRASDPRVQAEIDELRAVSDRLGALAPGPRASAWRDDEPSPALAGAVLASTEGSGSARRSARPSARPSAPRRRLGLVAAAVALVAVGAGGALGVQQLVSDDTAEDDLAVQGPPGTLGAVEPVAFAADDDPADVDAALVAHTWGTEAVLDVEGLPPGQVYDVVFLDVDGTEVSAGAFLGSTVEIHCSVNAAILREDVRVLRIQLPDGTVVRSAELPAVAT